MKFTEIIRNAPLPIHFNGEIMSNIFYCFKSDVYFAYGANLDLYKWDDKNNRYVLHTLRGSIGLNHDLVLEIDIKGWV